jgi:hypothetical protein
MYVMKRTVNGQCVVVSRSSAPPSIINSGVWYTVHQDGTLLGYINSHDGPGKRGNVRYFDWWHEVRYTGWEQKNWNHTLKDALWENVRPQTLVSREVNAMKS